MTTALNFENFNKKVKPLFPILIWPNCMQPAGRKNCESGRRESCAAKISSVNNAEWRFTTSARSRFLASYQGVFTVAVPSGTAAAMCTRVS
jgi:hypothetical protein